MAKVFETWTVLPHKPVEKLEPNLWLVHGTMPSSSTKRVMTAARRSDGRLVIHNPVALDDAEMRDLEAFGAPGFLVVPNGFHRQDSKIYKQRYPQAQVVAPRGAYKRVAQVVAPEQAYDTVPSDDVVSLQHLRGVKDMEGVMLVKSPDAATLIFNDAVCNMPRLGMMGDFMMGPTGAPSVPRVMRWLAVKDKAAFAGHLRELAEVPKLKRLIFGHGKPVTQDAANTLRHIADRL